MGPSGAAAAFGVGFFMIRLVMMVGMVVGCIIFLVAAWRTMKAHESISQTSRFILDEMTQRNYRSQQPPVSG